MNLARNIARNTAVYGISQVITSVAGFLLLLYLARYLGEAEYGKYSFAISLTAMFVIFIDIGINQLTIRELARNRDAVGTYITNTVLIRVISSVLAMCIIMATVRLAGYPQDVLYVIFLFSIYTILNTIAITFKSILQAFEKIDYLSALLAIEKLMLLPPIWLALVYGYGLAEVAYIYVATSVVDLILSSGLVLMKIGRPGPKVDIPFCRWLIIQSTPFALNSLFSILFFRIDTIMLSIFSDYSSVGIYNAAYNPLLAVCAVISGMAVAVLYPIMSRYFISSRSALEDLSVISTKYMAMIGVPIAVGCFILADRFIDLFYAGQYTASIFTFQILALFIPIRLISSVTGTILSSINKQKVRTFGVGCSALFNIILNLILIPHMGYLGAAISTVLSELVLYVLYIYYINKCFISFYFYHYLVKPLLASVIMGITIMLLENANLFLIIAVGAIVYAGSLAVLGGFSDRDRSILKRIIDYR